MSNFPDFSEHGYQIVEELGRNREGGRITWRAIQLETNKIVVLKQFCFATIGSSWSGFKACDREIEVLQRLNHPGIPKYLGSFQTINGFCLIQEYKDAPSLAIERSYTPEEIKAIASGVLEILVYLQSLIPPVIHRDLKPENILLDSRSKIYLIDFGFASLGMGETSVSSIFQGTPGFIPPEQIIKPTKASDLYALGVTLICLLTGKRSTSITELITSDNPYQLEFKALLPRLNLRFVNWLEKMVQPSLQERFSDAQEALEELLPIDIARSPQVKINRSQLNLASKTTGEKLTNILSIANEDRETLLAGSLSIISEPNNNVRDYISLSQQSFTSNQTDLQITVDTKKLLAGTTYHSQLLVKTNADPETYIIPITIQTADISTNSTQSFYLKVGISIVSIFAVVLAKLTFANPNLSMTPEAIAIGIVGAIVSIVTQISSAAIANSLMEAMLITFAISGLAILAATIVMGSTAGIAAIAIFVIAEAIALIYLAN
jgi:serine/threonine protein kinase